MKFIKTMVIYIGPILVCFFYFFLSSYSYTAYTLNFFDIFILFLILPIGYGVYNALSETVMECAVRNIIFTAIHSLGCYMNDFVYLDGIFGISYQPVDAFVGYVILTDIFIEMCCYIGRRAARFMTKN